MTYPPSHHDAALEERFLVALDALDELQRVGGPLPLVARAVSEADTLRLQWAARGSTPGALVVRAERLACELWAVRGGRRNADEEIPPLPVLERRFAATIAAFDRCIHAVETNVSAWDFVGGPFAVGATLSNRAEETAQARSDRKKLVAQWAESKTDAERFELVRRAERWYRISAEVLDGCRGITPSMAGAIVDQVKGVAGDAFDAAVDAGRAAFAMAGKPLVYAGLGIGGLLVLLAAARRRS